MVSADGPARVLAGAVRFLPKGRREWGRAMRAELAAIAPDGGRWRFVLSCLRVVAAQRLAPRALGYLLLGSAVLAGVVALTSPIGYPPLRRGLVGLVAVLVAGSGLARRRWLLGAAGTGRVARLVGAGGYLVVGALALSVVLDMRGPVPNPGETASAGVPIYTLLLTVYLVGFLAVTARRCAATGRVLATGAGSGVAAALLWLGLVLLAPPVPADLGLAFAVIATAMTGAGYANAGRRGGIGSGWLAALCAATVAAPLIVLLVWGLARSGPAGLIPDLAPAALAPADALDQSRIEINDPYVGLLALGCLAAAALAAVSVATGRRAAARPRAVAAAAPGAVAGRPVTAPPVTPGTATSGP